METLSKVDTVVTDKTGTLTEGKPGLVSVHSDKGMEADELLRLAAGLERASEHPLADAIVDGASARGITAADAESFESITGMGVTGRVEGRSVVLGNTALLAQLDIGHEHFQDRAEVLRSDGQTAIFVAVDGQAMGLLGVADPIKSTSREAILELQREGLKVVMLSGDNLATAEAVAQKLSIEEVIAGVLPAEKVERIQALQAAGRTVAMAGDGINDAPALAQSDVGIAMGTGTDVAMESAGITLVGGDLRGIVRARRLSRATMKNIRQNLFFAFFYNSLGVPVAAGILYPWFGILLSPMIAAAAMSFSSVSVIANALRLNRLKL
jgi:Cu+-exporting ATPase